MATRFESSVVVYEPATKQRTKGVKARGVARLAISDQDTFSTPGDLCYGINTGCPAPLGATMTPQQAPDQGVWGHNRVGAEGLEYSGP